MHVTSTRHMASVTRSWKCHLYHRQQRQQQRQRPDRASVQRSTCWFQFTTCWRENCRATTDYVVGRTAISGWQVNGRLLPVSSTASVSSFSVRHSSLELSCFWRYFSHAAYDNDDDDDEIAYFTVRWKTRKLVLSIAPKTWDNTDKDSKNRKRSH